MDLFFEVIRVTGGFLLCWLVFVIFCATLIFLSIKHFKESHILHLFIIILASLSIIITTYMALGLFIAILNK